MKKFLPAILFLLVPAACENPLDYTPADTSSKLIVNALLEVGAETHAVYLGISEPDCLDTIKNGTVACYVNGVKVADAVHADAREWPKPHYAYLGSGSAYDSYMDPFIFEADFREGDEVRIEATANNGAYKASATVIVPSRPVMGKVTMEEKVRHIEGDYEYKVSVLSVPIEDVSPEPDYYSIALRFNYTIDGYDEGLYVTTEKDWYYLDMDTSEDIILSEDNVVSSRLEGDLFDIGSPNVFGAFLDGQFNGGAAVLHPSVYSDYLWIRSLEMESIADYIHVSRSMTVMLCHIPERQYYYYKALNGFLGSGSDLALEDISIPDNVDGGIGFVGIAYPVFQEIELQPYSYFTYIYEY